MPNQLAKSKRRQSLAEHEAVLAALAEIARSEDTTVMALLRQAARELVRKRGATPALAKALSAVVWRSAPQMPAQFKTAPQVARFKRAQREFDQVVLDLQLASPDAIQERNSLVNSRQVIRLIDFDHAHATVAT
jgi:predicted nucleic acid-binding Zn ribbon protein